MLRKLLFNPIITRSLSPRLCSTETLKPTFDIPQKLKKAKDQPSDSTHGFETLLRNSTFTQMGDPVGKVVVGKIYHVVDDDLYIDFGSKFPCICPRPRGPLKDKYRRGVEVNVRIKRLEIADKFLGYDNEVSLLEADCVLVGLKEENYNYIS